MVRAVTLLVAIGLLACSSAPGARNGALAVASGPGLEPRAPMSVNDPVVQFLLDSAASDFRAHGPPGITRFRNTRVGHLQAQNGETRYLLCGEFQTDKPEWTAFTTIKTDPYEQWIGSHTAYCQSPSVAWDSAEDLSSALQARLEASR
jgi:hypothetical protein